MFDILIKGGSVIDGTGYAAEKLDIAVTGDEIVALGKLDNAEAAESIDAEGLHVCPGFIDIHSHSDFNILAYPPGQSKIEQGVTTEVCGNCGLSAAPLFGMARRQREKSLKALGIAITWSTLEEFTRMVQGRALPVNIVPLIGHGNIRGSVIGYEKSEASPDELKQMISLLEQEMRAGAWGLSSGLIYPPGLFASEHELAMLARAIRKFDGIYTSHIRSEGDQLIEALEEALNIGRQAGVPVQISHLKTMGRQNWHKLPAAFEIIEKARESGVAVTADRYPYTASSTDLDAILPAWVIQGGAEAELERLRRPELRDKIFSGIRMPENELAEDILISAVFSQKNKHLEGKLLGQAAEIRKQKVQDALFELLIEEELQVDAIFFSMSEDNLKHILRKDYCMIGSDASVRDITGALSAGKPHPRGFGTFPRAIRKYALEENILTLESAIRKMTGQPANTLGLRDRGLIKKGHKADIVIFSLKDIQDTATYENPHQYPSGIQNVMVNGRWALKKGSPTGEYPGKLLLKK